MKRHAYYIGCDGKFGPENGIESAQRSPVAATKRDPKVLARVGSPHHSRVIRTE